MTDFSPLQQEAIALSALFQACYLVDKVATTGQWDADAAAPLIRATIELNPEHFGDIYPELNQLHLGRDLIKQLFTQQTTTTAHKRTLQYAMTVIYVSKQARKNTLLISNLQQRLKALDEQQAFFTDITGPELTRRLSGIYSDTISTLPKRIRVPGKPEHLQNELGAARIRTLLLTAIRAAFLWHQVGGRQWRLLFSKKRLVQALDIIQ